VWSFLKSFGGAANPLTPVEDTRVIETDPLLAMIGGGVRVAIFVFSVVVTANASLSACPASGLLGWNLKLWHDGERAEPSANCDAVSSRRPCWNRDIRRRRLHAS